MTVPWMYAGQYLHDVQPPGWMTGPPKLRGLVCATARGRAALDFNIPVLMLRIPSAARRMLAGFWRPLLRPAT